MQHTSMKRTEVARNIQELLKQRGGCLDLSLLPGVYKTEYGTHLTASLIRKQFGVRFVDFLGGIPSLVVRKNKKGLLELRCETPKRRPPPIKIQRSTVEQRIEQLLLRNTVVELSSLESLYKSAFDEDVNAHELGERDLRSFISSLPSVEEFTNHSGIVSLRLVGDNDSSVIETTTSTLDNIPSIHAVLSDKIGESFKPSYDDSIAEEKKDETETETCVNLNVESFYNLIYKPSQDSDKENSKNGFVNSTKAFVTSLTQNKRVVLGDEASMSLCKERGLLGCLPHGERLNPVYLNTHDPFCLAIVGVQGAGKSHTLGCVLENCLVPADDVVRLQKPMTALVLHYDQNVTSVCEVAGLLSSQLPGGPRLARSKAVVLVSPTFYKQRKAFYGDYCTTRPLLFKWSSLTADHIKRIMRIGPNDNQLYVASFMTLLRSYQQRNVVPKFTDFVKEVKKKCNLQGQTGALDQRLDLLHSVVAESPVNIDIAHESMDLTEALRSHDIDLIIADLTDPLLAKDDANSLFQVITEQFRSTSLPGGKVLALDEAHRFMDGVNSDGLSQAIVDACRLMRHDGMRLVVSTQSPKALAPELLELVSIGILHHFHSKDWWTYIRQKLPLPDDAFDDILSLSQGHAIVFAAKSALEQRSVEVAIRPRLTADFGASRQNK